MTIIPPPAKTAFQGLQVARGYVPGFTRANLPTSYSDGLQPQGQFRIRHQPLVAGSSIRLLYVNWNVATGAQNPVFPQITIKAGWENPYGYVAPVTFNGLRLATIDSGGFVISDPIVLDEVGPANNPFPYYWSRTLVTTTTVFPTVTAAGAGTGDSWDYGSGLADKTLLTGALGTNTLNGNHFGPAAVLIDPAVAQPVVFGLGDSITGGTGDTATATGALGFVMRALQAANLPFVIQGVPSEQARLAFAVNQNVAGQQNIGLTQQELRALLMAGATHVIAQHGVNDLNPGLGNKSAAQTEAILASYWTQAAARRGKVYATTLTPRTTSTDSWATVGNQTATAENAARITVNTWIRAGAPIDPTTKAPVAVGTSGALLAGASGHPLTGYFEVADTVESGRDSGKWKAAYTADGVHPNATAAAAASAAITAATFTV